MAYGIKYSGSDVSVDGSTYIVEILKNGYSGAVTTIVLSKPGIVPRWGQRGDDVYTPIRPSSAEILVFDKAKVLQAEVFNADEEMFRLRIKKGSNIYWLGKIITDGFEDSLDLAPESTKILAIDGLGQLEGIGFEETTRVSIVQCVADLLKDIGLDLNIRFASNWYTPDILSSEDPLARIQTERLAERGDAGEILSSREVLEEYLTRHGLQLHQSGGIWRVTQRELLKESGHHYFEYDKDGVYVTDDVETPAVTVGESEQYGKRLKGGRKPYKAAYKTTTVTYFPKLGSGTFVPNNSFEDWAGDPLLPVSWEPSPGLDVYRNTIAKEGISSCWLPSYCDADPSAMPTGYLRAICNSISGNSKLRFNIGAQLSLTLQGHGLLPREHANYRAYFKILFGNYYLHRAQDGELSWVTQGQGGPYDDYIRYESLVRGPFNPSGWGEDIFVTPTLPQSVGQLTVYLYQVVEPHFSGTPPLPDYILGIVWDSIQIDQLVLGETTEVTGLKTVSYSIVLPNTVNRDSVQFRIGDGPSSLTPSRLTIGSTTLTGNWKRGAYSGEDPTGTSIDAMCAKTWLRAQKQPLEIHNATYTARAAAGALIEAHNVLVIGAKRFAFTYLERDLIAGRSKGEWIELRADDSDMLTTIEVIVEEGGTNVVRRDTKYGDSNVVGSETYASGFAGSGWRIEKIGNRYKLFIDDLEVRGSMAVGELVFQQKRVVNGSLFIGRCGVGRAESMTKIE